VIDERKASNLFLALFFKSSISPPFPRRESLCPCAASRLHVGHRSVAARGGAEGLAEGSAARFLRASGDWRGWGGELTAVGVSDSRAQRHALGGWFLPPHHGVQ
jgi:hypothetical protein